MGEKSTEISDGNQKSDGEESQDEEENFVTENTSDQDEVDLREYPVGQSPDVISAAVEEGIGNGTLGEVLSQYDPEQFNQLISRLSGEYQSSQKRKIRYHLATMGLSIVLVLVLFTGLIWFTLETGRDGGALIFFTGTLAGYFMRLATEMR